MASDDAATFSSIETAAAEAVGEMGPGRDTREKRVEAL